jgi:hypothetical protein
MLPNPHMNKQFKNLEKVNLLDLSMNNKNNNMNNNVFIPQNNNNINNNNINNNNINNNPPPPPIQINHIPINQLNNNVNNNNQMNNNINNNNQLNNNINNNNQLHNNRWGQPLKETPSSISNPPQITITTLTNTSKSNNIIPPPLPPDMPLSNNTTDTTSSLSIDSTINTSVSSILPSPQIKELMLETLIGGGAFGQVWKGNTTLIHAISNYTSYLTSLSYLSMYRYLERYSSSSKSVINYLSV